MVVYTIHHSNVFGDFKWDSLTLEQVKFITEMIDRNGGTYRVEFDHVDAPKQFEFMF